MSYEQQAVNAHLQIEQEFSKRKRNSKAKTELNNLIDEYHNAMRSPDIEESSRQWLEVVDNCYYMGDTANKRFLKKVCFPYDRDIESLIKPEREI